MKANNCLSYCVVLYMTSFWNCIRDTDFITPLNLYTQELVANTSFTHIKNMYLDAVVQIREDLVIEGYIVSSDETSNFFGSLHFQDKPNNATQGFQIEIDIRDSHLLYVVGSKIALKLKGLYLGKSKGVYKLGGVFTSFGNKSVGRLPVLKAEEHLFVTSNEVFKITPKKVDIGDLDDSMVNTLVQLSDIEIVEDELGKSFAEEKKSTLRTLKNCTENKIALLNSGYANFYADPLPEGNGTITAVLLKDRKGYLLVVRNLNDIRFSNERCTKIIDEFTPALTLESETPEDIDEFTSTHIFISELADPNNNKKGANARFVELYNSSSESLSLKGWTLRRYTNEKTEISSTIDLSGFSIDGESTFVISPKPLEFKAIYGFEPNLGASRNSPADSNGDDNLELVDPFGIVIDRFGIIGEDGSNTNHEFEDGRAFRKLTIIRANANYTFEEWMIYNDTGASQTINSPKNAPEDFTPGIRD